MKPPDALTCGYYRHAPARRILVAYLRRTLATVRDAYGDPGLEAPAREEEP